MAPVSKLLLFRTPRILGMLLAVFLSLLAGDSFEPGRPVAKMLLAFLIHLIPAAIVIATLVIAWRWELAGGILFLALALSYILLAGSRQPLAAHILLAGVPAVMGVLFLADWLYQWRQKHA